MGFGKRARNEKIPQLITKADEQLDHNDLRALSRKQAKNKMLSWGFATAVIICGLSGFALASVYTRGDVLASLNVAGTVTETAPVGTVKGRLLATCMDHMYQINEHEAGFVELNGGLWQAYLDEPYSKMKLTSAASYLNCVANIDQQRFCKADERIIFAGLLSRYYRITSSMTLQQAMMQQMVSKDEALKKSAQQIDALNRHYMGRGFLLSATDRESSEEKSLVRSVQVLADRGLLNARDFGWFGFGVPKHLRELFGKERPITALCQ